MFISKTLAAGLKAWGLEVEGTTRGLAGAVLDAGVRDLAEVRWCVGRPSACLQAAAGFSPALA